VHQAAGLLQDHTDAVLVTYGDMPLLRSETLTNLVVLFQSRRNVDHAALAMLTVERDDPQGFGRVVRNEHGEIVSIVEEADCTPDQLTIRELNPGVYCFDAAWLWENLPIVAPSAKGEYYLTDMVGIAVNQGRSVLTTSVCPEEVNGINTRVHLAQSAAVMRRRILDGHMLGGVTIVDPDQTYIDDTVEIAQDVTILPGSLLQGETRIGAHSIIGPQSHVVNSIVGENCRVTHSVVEEATVEDYCDIGPFSHLRKGAHLAEQVHLGNFAEVKNSYLGPGTKMGHFSYLGDTHIAGSANIGAGTITCNFDGQNKHRTTVGLNVFVGSDTLLVAPVSLGDGARTGAGSVVTKDVPPNTLVYGVPAREPRARTADTDDSPD